MRYLTLEDLAIMSVAGISENRSSIVYRTQEVLSDPVEHTVILAHLDRLITLGLINKCGTNSCCLSPQGEKRLREEVRLLNKVVDNLRFRVL